jgi:RHS repeat-associated protein
VPGVPAALLFTAAPARAVLPPTTTYYHGDGTATTLLVTDAAGAVVERAVYRPFGRIVPATPGGSTAAPEFGFAGERTEAAWGGYDFGLRWYHPDLALFLQPDPFVVDPADPRTGNPYAYACHNPLAFVDPSGGIPIFNYTIGPPPTSITWNDPWATQDSLTLGGASSWLAPIPNMPPVWAPSASPWDLASDLAPWRSQLAPVTDALFSSRSSFLPPFGLSPYAPPLIPGRDDLNRANLMGAFGTLLGATAFTLPFLPEAAMSSVASLRSASVLPQLAAGATLGLLRNHAVRADVTLRIGAHTLQRTMTRTYVAAEVTLARYPFSRGVVDGIKAATWETVLPRPETVWERRGQTLAFFLTRTAADAWDFLVD